MFERLLSKELQRRRALAKAAPGIMQDYLTTPLPNKDGIYTDADIVALDLETTGLDPQQDNILSYGLVHLRDRSIHLETARHQVIQVQEQIPEASAVIHQITDDRAAEGKPLDLVLPEILEQLAGRVMLVHFAGIEQGFLDSACRRLYGAPFVIRTIDTLILARRLFELRNHTIQANNLRLFNLRPLYNLPQYKAHNALSDALATAELFLAMAAEMYPEPQACTLGRFLTD
ncbi:MAG: exonuclease domain-containing protein [Chromatiales bacterium]|jgi:DNA polymerase-3 subunit epsilon